VNPAVAGVFLAKSVRTFCYGFLGILLPLYLAQLGLDARGVGLAITCTLAGSAALTWAVRRPAERLGGRAALIGLAALSAVAAGLMLTTANPWLVVLAAMLGNVAVGTGETGPFLSVEQVVIARGRTPVARLVPMSTPAPARKFGAMRGRARVTSAFFEPLPPDELDAWD